MTRRRPRVVSTTTEELEVRLVLSRTTLVGGLLDGTSAARLAGA